jgi:hypothetical protein
MSVDGNSVRAINRAYAKIPISEKRADELPIELNQLKEAIETAGPRVDFDVDPFDFRAALLEFRDRDHS